MTKPLVAMQEDFGIGQGFEKLGPLPALPGQIVGEATEPAFIAVGREELLRDTLRTARKVGVRVVDENNTQTHPGLRFRLSTSSQEQKGSHG